MSKKDIGLVDEVMELLKNLISMESHAQSSYKTTGDERFLQAKEQIRSIRTEWLDTITKKNFGQVWCFTKHAFECLMRLDEIQARFLSTQKISESKVCSEHYKKILYWIIELNEIGGNINVSKKNTTSA